MNSIAKEKRKLLLVDLCARLPHRVKIDREWIAPMTGSPEHSIVEFDTFDIEVLTNYCDEEKGGLIMCEDGRSRWVRKYKCKPYLRPMSSMTEEEKEELLEIVGKESDIVCEQLKNNDCGIKEGKYHFNSVLELDFLLSHHFDFRGLIPKGLALEAPKDMYNI